MAGDGREDDPAADALADTQPPALADTLPKGLGDTQDSLSRAAAGSSALAAGSVPLAAGSHGAAVHARGSHHAESPRQREGSPRISESVAPAPMRGFGVVDIAFLALAALALASIAMFVARFLLADAPPLLHAAYRAGTAAKPGALGSMGFLDGPGVTIAANTLVAITYLTVAVWIAQTNRREPMVQLLCALAILAGQYSMQVTLLTSTETAIAPRLFAAALYVALPAAALVTLALFPSGKPVPRASIYVVPLAVVPFALQSHHMYSTRGYSVPIAVVSIAGIGLLFACQAYRYRHHASLRERHQIKWLGYAGAVFLSIQTVAIAFVLPLLADRAHPAFPFLRVLYELMITSSYLAALVFVMFSAARYRLWDVDRVINRSVVYAIVTLLLGAVFALAYFPLRAVLPDSISAPVAAISVIALFVPSRRAIARLIDRRFYGIGIDYEGLAAKAARAAALPAAGQLAGYEDLTLLGKGGMGAVYRAHHAELGVPVVLKVMSPALAGDADSQARFRREAQILDDFKHPNVVPFLASGHDGEVAFIAMQYLEGEDVSTLLKKRGQLTVPEVVAVLDGAAAALDAAHARGIVHRDIKPSNLYLEGAVTEPIATRRTRVMDFGVAKLAGEPPLEDDDEMVGSLLYMAPEQIHNANEVDGRADVYSLGATAYELLTGRPPFRASTALGLVMAHQRQPPTDPRAFAASLSPAAAAVVLEALAKTPADRFATCGALVAALRATGEPGARLP